MDKSAYERNITRSIDLSGSPVVKGLECNEEITIQNLLDAYATTGFQATNLAQAIKICKLMREENAVIFLSFTSNMVSSGLRDIIRYLVEHKLVHCLVTTAGGIEEDVIKTLDPFVIGSFNASGKMLFESGVNRTGNIFVPNDRYTFFEQFMRPFLVELQEKHGDVVSMLECTRALGQKVQDKSSILHWASKNDIPVICPAPMDGALGDMIYYHMKKHGKFRLDVARDVDVAIRLALNAEKTGVLCLGGGVPKHFILNANIFREGADFAVYITTANEFDGSDSGGSVQEAMTWGKVRTDAPNVKVVCDATIAFPLIVAGAFRAQ